MAKPSKLFPPERTRLTIHLIEIAPFLREGIASSLLIGARPSQPDGDYPLRAVDLAGRWPCGVGEGSRQVEDQSAVVAMDKFQRAALAARLYKLRPSARYAKQKATTSMVGFPNECATITSRDGSNPTDRIAPFADGSPRNT